jgi:hypothetical protein
LKNQVSQNKLKIRNIFPNAKGVHRHQIIQFLLNLNETGRESQIENIESMLIPHYSFRAS